MEMYKLTGRIFENGKLTGYTIFDGSSTAEVSKMFAWNMAKRGEIEDVKTILVNRPSEPNEYALGGKNGFRVLDLPVIDKTVKKTGAPDKECRFACVIKQLCDEPKSRDSRLITEYISKSAESVVEHNGDTMFNRNRLDVDSYEFRRLSNSIIVESEIMYGFNTLGYKIRNIGEKGVCVNNFKCLKCDEEYTYILQPSEARYMSLAEMNMTLSHVNFAGRVYNGALLKMNNRYTYEVDLPLTTIPYIIMRFKLDETTNKYKIPQVKMIETLEDMSVGDLRRLISYELINCIRNNANSSLEYRETDKAKKDRYLKELKVTGDKILKALEISENEQSGIRGFFKFLNK